MPRVPPSITCLVKIESATNTSKFWALGFAPTKTGVPSLKLWWGRIGTRGQEQVVGPFTSDAQCLEEARMRTEDKLREGYIRAESTDFKAPFLDDVATLATDPPRNSDGWPLDDRGIAMRPGARLPLVITGPARTSIPQAVERARDALLKRDALERAAAVSIRKRVEPVKLAHDRVIDFEE